MSLSWLIYRSGAIGGGAALVGWAAAEYLGVRHGLGNGMFGEALTCAVVGGAIGVGMSLVVGARGSLWSRDFGRVVAGLVVGSVAGCIGMSLGHAFLGILHGSRALGWVLMGGGVGAAEGLYERSTDKLKRGVVAAAIGGLAGGLPFGTIYSLVSTVSEAGSRAIAFLILGTCVGALLGLAKAMFAEAWLTVVEGQRPGRQLLLSSPSAVLGTARCATLLFTAQGENDVDSEHARIVRQPDGRFALEDMHSRHGTFINLQRVFGRVVLGDGDLIKIGANSIRFNTRTRLQKSDDATAAWMAPPRQNDLAASLRMPKSQECAASAITEPAATKPSPSVPAHSLGKRPSGMSFCPQCRRPVPGTRPYCVICKLSF